MIGNDPTPTTTSGLLLNMVIRVISLYVTYSYHWVTVYYKENALCTLFAIGLVIYALDHIFYWPCCRTWPAYTFTIIPYNGLKKSRDVLKNQQFNTVSYAEDETHHFETFGHSIVYYFLTLFMVHCAVLSRVIFRYLSHLDSRPARQEAFKPQFGGFCTVAHIPFSL